MSGARKTGDWAKARALLTSGPARLKGAIDIALRQEAHALRGEIVQGLTKQAPGGRAIKPPSELTFAARRLKGFGGSKALLVRGDLRNSITVIIKGNKAFIGVSRKARSRDGESMVNIAEIQEFGSAPTVIPMTPAMRRFLFVLLREAGKTPRGGSGKGVIVVQTPARPFLRPAFDKFKRGVRVRFLNRVAKLSGMGG